MKNEAVVLKCLHHLNNRNVFLSPSSLPLFFKVLKGDIEQDGCLSVAYKLICLHYRLYSNGPIMY